MHDAAAETQRRKEEHLRIPLERDVSTPDPWRAVRLRHQPLPGIDKDDVRLATRFLGHDLGAPVQITGMTGGARKAQEFNDRLAAAAAEHQVAMGVGSQRAALENPELTGTYAVILDHDVPLRFANLGLPQVVAWGDQARERAEQAIAMVEAHALCIHLNFLQEAVMPEGDTQAAGGLEAIQRLCDDLDRPVIVKETGAGIPGPTASALVAVGVAAVDVGGLGGTSFAAVEHYRAVDQQDATKARLGKTFWDWGNWTPDCVRSCHAAEPELPLVATGGLRTGLDALKAFCLGASIAGYAGTMFCAAADDSATAELAMLLEELKTGLFLTGCPHPEQASEDHLA